MGRWSIGPRPGPHFGHCNPSSGDSTLCMEYRCFDKCPLWRWCCLLRFVIRFFIGYFQNQKTFQNRSKVRQNRLQKMVHNRPKLKFFHLLSIRCSPCCHETVLDFLGDKVDEEMYLFKVTSMLVKAKSKYNTGISSMSFYPTVVKIT